MYTAEGGGVRGYFLEGEKFATHPCIMENVFTPPPPPSQHTHTALDQNKKTTTPPVLLRKVKHGQYYKMMQRLIENKIKR